MEAKEINILQNNAFAEFNKLDFDIRVIANKAEFGQNINRLYVLKAKLKEKYLKERAEIEQQIQEFAKEMKKYI